MSFLRILERPQLCTLCLRARRLTTTAVSRAENPKVSVDVTAAAATPLSSCTKDTVLTGLNYLKGQPPVLAAADEDYPPWLWTVLQAKVWPDDGPGGKAERVKRRMENRQRIKDRNFMSTQ